MYKKEKAASDTGPRTDCQGSGRRRLSKRRELQTFPAVREHSFHGALVTVPQNKWIREQGEDAYGTRHLVMKAVALKTAPKKEAWSIASDLW